MINQPVSQQRAVSSARVKRAILNSQQSGRMPNTVAIGAKRLPKNVGNGRGNRLANYAPHLRGVTKGIQDQKGATRRGTQGMGQKRDIGTGQMRDNSIQKGRVVVMVKKCAFEPCGARFESVKPHAKFCSNACRMKAYRRRKKQR